MTSFHQLLVNNLVANITNFTVWFAITFWVYLETRSVFATGMIAGIYLVLTAAFGIWFGSLVDHHRKKMVMLGSSVGLVRASTPSRSRVYCCAPERALRRRRRASRCGCSSSLVMLGVIAGNIRTIALPTLVTAAGPGGPARQGERPGRHGRPASAS